MASPAPSSTSATGGPMSKAQPQEQITFRFCRECSNMLYPKEDRMTNKLMFACRTCQFSEEAQSSCVFRNNMYNTVGETAGVTQDVGSDPTVCDPDSDDPFGCGWYCTFCGKEVDDSDAGDVEGELMDVDGKGEDDEKAVRVGVFNLAEMSRMEEEEDGEPEECGTDEFGEEEHVERDDDERPEHKTY